MAVDVVGFSLMGEDGSGAERPVGERRTVQFVTRLLLRMVSRVLSRCPRKSAMGLQLWKLQVPATASRHVLIAATRKLRCVEAEVRWRWTLKVLKTAA
jgi:hypothetical protein